MQVWIYLETIGNTSGFQLSSLLFIFCFKNKRKKNNSLEKYVINILI